MSFEHFRNTKFVVAQLQKQTFEVGQLRTCVYFEYIRHCRWTSFQTCAFRFLMDSLFFFPTYIIEVFLSKTRSVFSVRKIQIELRYAVLDLENSLDWTERCATKNWKFLCALDKKTDPQNDPIISRAVGNYIIWYKLNMSSWLFIYESILFASFMTTWGPSHPTACLICCISEVFIV